MRLLRLLKSNKMKDTQFLILEDGPDLEERLLNLAATDEVILFHREEIWYQAVVSERWGVEYRILPGSTEEEVKEIFLKTNYEKVRRRFPVINRCYRVAPVKDPKVWRRVMGVDKHDAIYKYCSEFSVWGVRVDARRDYDYDDVYYGERLVKRQQAEYLTKWDKRFRHLEKFINNNCKKYFYIFCQQGEVYLRKGGYGTTKEEREAGVFNANQALEIIEDSPLERGIKLIKVKGVNRRPFSRKAWVFDTWDSL